MLYDAKRVAMFRCAMRLLAMPVDNRTPKSAKARTVKLERGKMQVTGEKLLGFRARAVLAVCVATVLCVAMVQPAFAQDGTATEDQYAPGPDDECPGAVQVGGNITESDGDETAPFAITGERFRINITVSEEARQDADVSVSVRNDANDDFAAIGVTQNGPGTKSSIVNEGPGEFFLSIIASDTMYVVTVEDCLDANGAVTNPPADTTDPGDTTDPADVVDGTTPDKPLPDTGGLPLTGLVVIGLALVGIGGSIVRAGVERRS